MDPAGLKARTRSKDDINSTFRRYLVNRVTSGVTASALADHQNNVLEEFATRPLFYLLYQYQLTTNALPTAKVIHNLTENDVPPRCKMVRSKWREQQTSQPNYREDCSRTHSLEQIPTQPKLTSCIRVPMLYRTSWGFGYIIPIGSLWTQRVSISNNLYFQH